jgi:serine phosphatase RsbU (regulator of sigma subunit)
MHLIPPRVLAGINRILYGKLESDFVTAGYLYIDTIQQTASYAVQVTHPFWCGERRGRKYSNFGQKASF